ncbi:hypothetical protein Hanom_Chr04g00310141 [Helianthus anomalus]
MPSSYPGRHMSLPRLALSTSKKRWVSVANWAQLVASHLLDIKLTHLVLSYSFHDTSLQYVC